MTYILFVGVEAVESVIAKVHSISASMRITLAMKNDLTKHTQDMSEPLGGAGAPVKAMQAKADMAD